jgi:hypothetical protein
MVRSYRQIIFKPSFIYTAHFRLGMQRNVLYRRKQTMKIKAELFTTQQTQNKKLKNDKLNN